MSWFDDRRTMTKMLLGFTPVVAMLCFMGWCGIASTADANGSMELLFRRDVYGIDTARKCDVVRLKIARTFRDGMVATDPSEKDAKVREVERLEAEERQLLDEVDKTLILPENRARMTELRKVLSDYIAVARDAIRAGSVDATKASALRALALQSGDRIGDLLDAIISAKTNLATKSFEESIARAARSRNIIFGITAAAMAVAAAIAWFIGKAIGSPLAKSVEALQKVAKGDLTAHVGIARKDELGEMASALNAAIDSMRSTLASVQEVSQEVSAAASQLAGSAEQISSGAQEQAASLEETAASLEEISSTVKQNADNAQHATQLASGARDAAERGGQVVESAVAAMSEITRSSKHIADIITTIDEIAFQTNLLALNAAVEAARAGEQGRGFSVVAAEVRTLAQRTAAAAKEIRGLIADSSAKVEAGTMQVNHSGETLGEIVRSVKRVTDMVAEIAAASREQNTGVEQVNTAVTQVDQVTQSNAAQTEELAATATALSEKSGELQRLVSGFDLGTGHSQSPRVAEARFVHKAEPARLPPPKPVRGRTNSAVFRKPALAPAKAANGYEEF
ncbi:Methyl-accepting chemotaxis protein I (serine chemoreceptor protein) [Labilithrix luteola]|uniref:Methyl-accepting chemotaxis protein I (Serine chemoreceptor protein) n=1 Tax=Labilithrix luteola TaxID=1391654 RepID=A0A0K1PLQ4_9BACT|nr:methyl-accepting chemotaxis protein [Labilithrix luteola]AKU94044.1 Methyl-accepting chemotaxis protein I (serine chemoreceptor protein) [Labilithrix luteola]